MTLRSLREEAKMGSFEHYGGSLEHSEVAKNSFVARMEDLVPTEQQSQHVGDDSQSLLAPFASHLES